MISIFLNFGGADFWVEFDKGENDSGKQLFVEQSAEIRQSFGNYCLLRGEV